MVSNPHQAGAAYMIRAIKVARITLWIVLRMNSLNDVDIVSTKGQNHYY